MAMLTIQNIQKSFGGLPVLKGVDLTVDKGDVVAILGPSGSGKTTLLRCINFLEQADSGTMTFDGEAVTFGHVSKKQVAALRRKTAFVFQNYNLFRNKTALQNVTEGLIVARRVPRAQAEEIGRQMLQKVGMLERCDAYPHQLSGGQQQRVAIARALVKMPRVLLLDEPLSNLDARLRLQTREEIRRIQRETQITTIFVTHDQEEAMSISDMIVVMKDGVVQQIGKPQDVYDCPANLFVAKFLGTPPINVFDGTVKNHKLYIGKDAVLDVPGVGDRPVFVGVRPEGFILKEDGPLCCDLSGVEVMGRDISVISRNEASQSPTIRAIIGTENKVDVTNAVVRFALKPSKVFLFDKETEERIDFKTSAR